MTIYAPIPFYHLFSRLGIKKLDVLKNTKRLYFLVVLLLLCFVSSATAQNPWTAGTAVIYGDDIESFGLNGRIYHNFHGGRVCIGPEFTIFSPRNEEESDLAEERRLWEFNFNGHFILPLKPRFGAYILTGYNYSREVEDFTTSMGETEEEIITASGFNLGGGFHYELSHKWLLFMEYDHLFSSLEQNSFSFGIFLNIGKEEGEEGGRKGGH
ncbi:MAG: outer membrane beta-barrel protein [Bacteroidota bacterium]